MIFSPLNPKPKKGLQNQYSSKQTSAFEEEEDSSSSEEIRHSTAKNLGNSDKRFHEACRFQRSCQAEVITGDLDFICTRKHDLFSSERVPKGSTKPWVLIKLPAPTSDVTHCTADQHKARERIRPATSSCCIRSDKNTLLSSVLLAFVATNGRATGYSNLQLLFYTPRLTNSLSPMCFLEGIFHCLWLYHFKDTFCLFLETWTYLGASTWNDFLYPSFALALTLLAWQGTWPKVNTYTRALLTPI